MSKTIIVKAILNPRGSHALQDTSPDATRAARRAATRDADDLQIVTALSAAKRARRLAAAQRWADLKVLAAESQRFTLPGDDNV